MFWAEVARECFFVSTASYFAASADFSLLSFFIIFYFRSLSFMRRFRPFLVSFSSTSLTYPSNPISSTPSLTPFFNPVGFSSILGLLDALFSMKFIGFLEIEPYFSGEGLDEYFSLFI